MAVMKKGGKLDCRLLNYWVRLIRGIGAGRTFDQFFRFEKATAFLYTRLKFKAKLDYYPNLRNPRSFNEKSVHRRLFTRDPLWLVVSDKLMVREWLRRQGLDGGLGFVPLLDVIEDVEGYDFTKLQGPLVIKAAWGSGYNVFIDDPENADWHHVRKKLTGWIKLPYKPLNLSWVNANVNKRFIVERCCCPPGKRRLDDYKFMVFHGRVELLESVTYQGQSPLYSYFDRELRSLPDMPFDEGAKGTLDQRVSDMVSLAERIGRRFDFVRVDFFLYKGEILFGEITQCPANGFDDAVSEAFDFALGIKWHYVKNDLFRKTCVPASGVALTALSNIGRTRGY